MRLRSPNLPGRVYEIRDEMKKVISPATDQSEGIPATDEYLRALGRAVFNFAYLEWGVIWLVETMQRGFLNDSSKMTSGKIANRFCDAAEQLDDAVPDKQALRSLSQKFKCLVPDRNRLVHSHTYTAPEGANELMYLGRHGRKAWPIELMTDFASRAAAVSIEANGVLHAGRLDQYQSAKAADKQKNA